MVVVGLSCGFLVVFYTPVLVLVWVRLGLFFHAGGCLALDGVVRVGEDGV